MPRPASGVISITASLALAVGSRLSSTAAMVANESSVGATATDEGSTIGVEASPFAFSTLLVQAVVQAAEVVAVTSCRLPPAAHASCPPKAEVTGSIPVGCTSNESARSVYCAGGGGRFRAAGCGIIVMICCSNCDVSTNSGRDDKVAYCGFDATAWNRAAAWAIASAVGSRFPA